MYSNSHISTLEETLVSIESNGSSTHPPGWSRQAKNI